MPSAPFLDISFSHTATLAACALLDKRPLLSEAASSTEAIQAWQIGVDAEPLTSPSSRDPHAFSHRFFGKHEQALVATASDAARAMLEIFTVKEAYAKQCGEGLARHLSGSDTMAPDFCKRNGVCFKRFLLAHHTLALCLPSSLANIDVKYIEVDL